MSVWLGRHTDFSLHICKTWMSSSLQLPQWSGLGLLLFLQGVASLTIMQSPWTQITWSRLTTKTSDFSSPDLCLANSIWKCMPFSPLATHILGRWTVGMTFSRGNFYQGLGTVYFSLFTTEKVGIPFHCQPFQHPSAESMDIILPSVLPSLSLRNGRFRNALPYIVP